VLVPLAVVAQLVGGAAVALVALRHQQQCGAYE
jgi:hypothetical protein